MSEIHAAITHALAEQHEQAFSVWTCAKSYFPVSPAVIEYLISHSKKSKADSNSGSTVPCLLRATEADVLTSLAPSTAHRLRGTVLKRPSLLQPLYSHKWKQASWTYR